MGGEEIIVIKIDDVMKLELKKRGDDVTDVDFFVGRDKIRLYPILFLSIDNDIFHLAQGFWLLVFSFTFSTTFLLGGLSHSTGKG